MKQERKQEGQRSFGALWKTLGRSIYTGDRLKANLTALTSVSVFTAFLGIALVVMNLVNPPVNTAKIVMSCVTVLAGAGCAYLSHFRKNRNAAVMIPTLFCCIVFT